jgi:MFS transporter, MHS family, citrate/tricarballylate:H+ symporter
MSEKTEPRKTIPIHHVVAVVLGNGLEFYDFLTYAIFAVYIAKAYFPAGDPTVSLMFTFALSFISYLVRPVGAIVLGGLGDRIGRKPAMVISFAFMGVGMLGMALTPTYAMIGIAAPIAVLCFRMLQGFALGGEVGPTTAYLIEAAPPERRGFYGSMQYVSQDTAVFCASLVGVILSNLLSAAALESWGWRIAFLLGVVIVPFGILIRRTLPETLHKVDDAALAPDATTGRLSFATTIKPYTLLVFCGFFLLVSGTIGTYVTNYMPTFAINTLHLPATIAFTTTVVSSGIAVLCEPLAGYFSDLYGRRIVMIVPGIMTLLLIIPGYWLLTQYPTPVVIYALIAVLSVTFSLSTTPVIISLTESLPMHIRSGTVATVYALAISVFGGSTQVVVTWLLKITGHNPMVPAYYWTGAMILGLLAMSAIPESAPVKMKR